MFNKLKMYKREKSAPNIEFVIFEKMLKKQAEALGCYFPTYIILLSGQTHE